ncbi:MAG: fumarylacetoacetate hydrolase family protein [Woeseiaceae bacterium]|nr:fumarylacetoacetate hydrolase family protein [Woeseiaceae bacterium]
MTTRTKTNAVAALRLSERDDAISRCLVDARLTAELLPDFPDRLPTTLEQAYAIQSASIDRWPDVVVGWKVAMLPVPDRSRFPAERLAGPVFSKKVRAIESGSKVVMPVYAGGFAAVEAEFVLELGVSVLPTGKDYSDDELIDVVSAWHCGAEIASSPMAVVNERGATSIISDFGNNAGVLLGPRIEDWQTRPLDEMPAKVIVDGETAGETTAAAVPGGPLQALRFLIDLCASRGIDLPAGTLVSSGAVTGVHDVQMDSVARLEFGQFGSFEVTFEPVTPAT